MNSVPSSRWRFSKRTWRLLFILVSAGLILSHAFWNPPSAEPEAPRTSNVRKVESQSDSPADESPQASAEEPFAHAPSDSLAAKDNDKEIENSTQRPADRSVTTLTTIFENTRIRDENGRIVYQGTVDVRSTLQRIDKGERLKFAHDGTVFQNRERRLPKQPAGHYREYVHPTPRLSGPGPQRVVTGRDGEAYYTPDHYRTFRRIR